VKCPWTNLEIGDWRFGSEHSWKLMTKSVVYVRQLSRGRFSQARDRIFGPCKSFHYFVI